MVIVHIAHFNLQNYDISLRTGEFVHKNLAGVPNQNFLCAIQSVRAAAVIIRGSSMKDSFSQRA